MSKFFASFIFFLVLTSCSGGTLSSTDTEDPTRLPSVSGCGVGPACSAEQVCVSFLDASQNYCGYSVSGKILGLPPGKTLKLKVLTSAVGSNALVPPSFDLFEKKSDGLSTGLIYDTIKDAKFGIKAGSDYEVLIQDIPASYNCRFLEISRSKGQKINAAIEKLDIDCYSSGGGGGAAANIRWGTGGKVTTTVSGKNVTINSLATQSDGKVVAVGSASAIADAAASDIIIIRYNTNGTLDTTFNSTGIVTKDIATSTDKGYGVTLQSDGKIIVAGEGKNAGSIDAVVLRYNTDGTLDTTFATSGIYTYSAAEEAFYSAAVQSDGLIVAGGYTNGNFLVVRLSTSGALDTGFNTTGSRVTDVGGSDDQARKLVVQSDGKIILAGYSNATDSDSTLIRYNSNGTLDAAFGSSGIKTIDISGASADDFALGLAVNSSNKIIIGGYYSDGTRDQPYLAQLDSSGNLDTAFGTSGKVLYTTATQDERINAIALNSTGQILAAGTSQSGSNIDFRIQRYNSTGSIDSTFGTSGTTTVSIGSATDSDTPYAVVIQTDGKIILAGTVDDSLADDPGASIRVSAAGVLDS